eukprot:11174600-Lingulodinium_polyedra.AAC.1
MASLCHRDYGLRRILGPDACIWILGGITGELVRLEGLWQWAFTAEGWCALAPVDQPHAVPIALSERLALVLARTPSGNDVIVNAAASTISVLKEMSQQFEY